MTTATHEGLDDWCRIATQLPIELCNLLKSDRKTRSGHGASIPSRPGIYMFAEAERPRYVGQTRDLKRRIGDHCHPSGGPEKASFAFLIATREFKEANGESAETRSQLANNPSFSPYFSASKERVSQMTVQFIECACPELRTVFEVYAAIKLETTEYNSFETH